MSRIQNISRQPDTQSLPALLAANVQNQPKTRREPEAVPFTPAELRRMILEIMG